jgi:parallel beta-helix repeat protein
MFTKCRVVLLTISLTIIILLSIETQASLPNERVEQITVRSISKLERGCMRVSGTPHSSIIIDGDVNFNSTAQTEGWLGDGSLENPYIVDGMEIDGYDWCISISNTRVYFAISNCNLTGATFADGAGIFLYNVSNALLNNNTVRHSWRGIYLDQSSYNTVVNNNCTTNACGIYLDRSNSNIILNNTSNTKWGQDVSICLDNSDSNTVVNNSFMDAFVGGIYIDESSFNILTNNTCTHNSRHIWIQALSENNYIHWNVFADDSAPAVDAGTGNVFDHNYWADYGGSDADSDGIGDVPHTFLGNNDSYPLIYLPTPPIWNETPSEVIVEFTLSFFYLNLNVTCPSPLTWYVNDTLFSIDIHGRISSRSILPIDNYGLTVEVTSIYNDKLSVSLSITVLDTTPPNWLIVPIDQEREFGEMFVHQVAAVDLSGIDYWWLNDTNHFSIDQFGVIRNNLLLSPGVYGLNVTVYDSYHNHLSAIFSLNVKAATTTPTKTTEPTNSTIEGYNLVMTFVLGAGLGGTIVLVLVLVVHRRKS